MDDSPINAPVLPGSETASIAEDLSSGINTAVILLAVINGMAVSLYGEPARMTPGEQKLIEDPLARIMARYGAKANEAIQKWSDPVLLTLGLTSWAARVYAINRQKPPVMEPEPPRSASNKNGASEPARPADDLSAPAPPEIFDMIGAVS